jgi:signal transduction histidine kinase
MESAARVRSMTSMTGLPGAETAVPTLAALRQARANRIAALRRRAAPITTAVGVLLAFSIVRSTPRPGLHGKPLVVTVAGACFVLSVLALFRLLAGRLPVRPVLPAMPRAQALVMLLLVASSVTLEWLQSSSGGTIGLYIAVAVAARVYPRRVSIVMFSACFAYFLVVTVAGYGVWHGTRYGLPGFADLIALVAVYLMSMFARRVRIQEQQEEHLLAELEESRAAELRAAALAERQRLAREMHDVLAHSLSGLVVQLEGARMLAAADSGDARLPEVVDRAHQLAKSGLAEARQAIGMLRDADDQLPGTDRLPELAGDFTTDTGVPCRFTMSGEERPLSPEVRLALYRVAQEALTNVRKHASNPEAVQVALDYLPGEVTLTVEDTVRQPVRTGAQDTPQNGTPGGGYGLTGMRERAGLLGGVLQAGPTDTGFRVRLRVPA